MNSYFASVEQQANPFLRGKPVGVCAYLGEGGCIIASSVEAKKFGVKTGAIVRDARKLCPEITLIENNPDKYRSTTQKIFSILNSYTDVLEPYSIDEAFLNFTGLVKNFAGAQKITEEIKYRIKNEVGDWLKASQGLSFTKFLAKFASDNGAKDSVSLITNIREAQNWYQRLKLTDAWGIGQKIEIRLNELGIYSLLDLQKHPVSNLMQSFGKVGYYLWANLNGIEIDWVKNEEEILPKSIGHSYCLPKKTTDKEYLAKILMKLCEKTGRRLREKNLEAGSLSIYWGYTKIRGGFGKSFKIGDSFFSSRDIFNKAFRILQNYQLPDRVRMLAVSVSSLSPRKEQLSFFEDRVKKQKLCQAMDIINDKFGEYTVIYGQMWDTGDNARDRVGFRKTLRPDKLQDEVSYD